MGQIQVAARSCVGVYKGSEVQQFDIFHLCPGEHVLTWLAKVARHRCVLTGPWGTDVLWVLTCRVLVVREFPHRSWK